MALSGVLFLLLFTVSFNPEARGAVILTPSFSLSEEYTDNLFFSDQGAQTDFTTVLSPALSVTFKSKNTTLALVYEGSAQFHSHHPEADGYFQSLSFDLDLPILGHHIRGLEVKVDGKVSYSPELRAFSFGREEMETDIEEKFNQVLLEGEGVQQSGRVDTFRNYTSISLRYPWSRHIITSASYTNVITRYSNDRLEDTNIHSSFAEVSYRYPMSPRTTWTSRYGMSATFDKGRDLILIHQIDTEVVHRLTALVSLNGDVGASFAEGASSPGENLGAGISKRYKTGGVSFQYARRLAPGLGVIRELTRRQSLIGRATHVLGRINSSVQLGYASNRSFKGDEVNVDSYTVGASLSTHFFSWLEGTLNYTYLNQKSKGSVGKEGERNLVSFTLTGFGPPWRMIQ